MRLALATDAFDHPGGSETYLLTLAEQLERLGHDVVIRARRVGAMAETAARRGIRTAGADDELPTACDAIVSQDAPSAYDMAERFPGVPQLFRACSDVHDFQLPPSLPAVVRVAIVLSDRVHARVAAMAAPPPVVRLRQPVDVRRFSPAGRLNARPRRALVLGNYLDGDRQDALLRAWEAEGVECVRVGHQTTATTSPEAAMRDVDVVVGKARVIVEAMACGRAAYVYDFAGRDGWVTPERYPAMEADNFAGLSRDVGVGEDLAKDLAGYDAAMGDVNRDLAVTHHHAARHAEAVVELARGLAPEPHAVPVPAEELARLHRRQWAAESDAMLLRDELASRDATARAALQEAYAVHADRDAIRAELHRVTAERDALRDAPAPRLGRVLRRGRA